MRPIPASERRRWQTERQTMNKREITMDGKTMCVQEWCDLYGISRPMVWHRMASYGWTFEQALKTPLGVRPERKKQHLCVQRICKKCRHSWKTSGTWTCRYILDEFKRRPCPADKCTEFEKDTRKRQEPFMGVW